MIASYQLLTVSISKKFLWNLKVLQTSIKLIKPLSLSNMRVVLHVISFTKAKWLFKSTKKCLWVICIFLHLTCSLMVLCLLNIQSCRLWTWPTSCLKYPKQKRIRFTWISLSKLINNVMRNLYSMSVILSYSNHSSWKKKIESCIRVSLLCQMASPNSFLEVNWIS